MGVATGCGCKEVNRFPHTTYPYSSCICTFLQQHPYFFVHLKKCIIVYDAVHVWNHKFVYGRHLAILLTVCFHACYV